MSFLFEGLSKSKSPSIPLFQSGRYYFMTVRRSSGRVDTPFEKGGQGGFAPAVDGGQR